MTKSAAKKRDREDHDEITPVREKHGGGGGSLSPRDHLSVHQMPHKQLIEQLAASQIAIGKAVQQLADHATKEAEASVKPVPDEWHSAVSTAMGKAFPAEKVKDLSMLSESSILDPLIACDPFLMLLLMRRTKLEQWVEASVLSGPLLRQWRGFVSGERVWKPRQAAEKDISFLESHLTQLEQKLLELANAFYRWPSGCSAATFFLEKQPLLEAALQEAKELEGKNLAIRCGHKAAAEFFQAHRLGSRRCGASFIPAVAKIKIGRQQNGVDSDEEAAYDKGKSNKQRFQHPRFWGRNGGAGNAGDGAQWKKNANGATPVKRSQ